MGQAFGQVRFVGSLGYIENGGVNGRVRRDEFVEEILLSSAENDLNKSDN
jgi:hypothetical protein